MKSDDIKRSVRAQRHDRAAGDAPNMGRVSRMPGTGLPKGERRKRKRSEGGRNNKVRQGREFSIKIWSVMLLAGALVCLGVTIWLGLRPDRNGAAEIVAIPAVPAAEKTPPTSPKFPPPSEEEAIALARRALAVRDAAQVPQHFRADKVSPTGVVEFLKSLETRDGPVHHCEWLGSMDANDLEIEGVLVHFAAPDKKPRNRIALLTPDAEGVWKTDFDAFARTSDPSWADFQEKRADSIRCRVYAAQDSYFNGPFSDESQWICYGLASPDTDEILFGYCKIDSPQAGAMKWILSKQITLGRATLEIRRVPDALPRQFLISRVLAEDWVTGTEPFDRGFD
jgi:hypothetical protein